MSTADVSAWLQNEDATKTCSISVRKSPPSANPGVREGSRGSGQGQFEPAEG